MLFNSLDYLYFFPIVAFLYFYLPHSCRWLWLLSASYYFYISWKPIYIILLLSSTIVDYSVGRLLGRVEEKRYRNLLLGFSISVNLGLLFFFKYFDFFAANFNQIAEYFSLAVRLPILELVLPIGISFYTFQTLAYTIDVYRGKYAPEKHLGYFALYVSFFPQLIAGPIERASNLLHQLKREEEFDYDRVVNGLLLIAGGLFKKMVIADGLAQYVELVYSSPAEHTGLPLLIATFAFTYQVYCDFSGYTDIAIGSAQIFGIRLMENFERPFFSKNLSEFWRRMHISLSFWFRDYLYFPLGGSRVAPSRKFLNILIVFVFCGLWHGAAWTFVAWGVIQAFYFLFGALTLPIRERIIQCIGVNRTPTFLKILQSTKIFTLYAFSLVFFRANSLSDAFYVISHIHIGLISDLCSYAELRETLRLASSARELLIVFAFIAIMECLHLKQRSTSLRELLRAQTLFVRWSLYVVFIVSFFLFAQFEGSEFIYFQF